MKLLLLLAVLLLTTATSLVVARAHRAGQRSRWCDSKALVKFLHAEQMEDLERAEKHCLNDIARHKAAQERRAEKTPVPKAMKVAAKQCKKKAKRERKLTFKRLRKETHASVCPKSPIAGARARKCDMTYNGMSVVSASVYFDPRRSMCVDYTVEQSGANIDGDGQRALVKRGGALCIDAHGAPHAYDPKTQLCVAPEQGVGGGDFHLWRIDYGKQARCTITAGAEQDAGVRCSLGVLCARPDNEADVADVAHCRGQCYRKSAGECHAASRGSSFWYQLCDTAKGEHWCEAVNMCRPAGVECGECEKLGWRPCAGENADADEKMRSCVDPVWAGCSCTSQANWGTSDCTVSYRREPKWTNAIEGGDHTKTTPYAQELANEDADAEWKRKFDAVDKRCKTESANRCGLECLAHADKGKKECMAKSCPTHDGGAATAEPGCVYDPQGHYSSWQRSAICARGQVFCANECRDADSGHCHEVDRDAHVPGAEFERWCATEQHWCAHEAMCRDAGEPCDRCKLKHKHSINKGGVKSAWKKCGWECYDARWALCDEQDRLVFMPKPRALPGSKKNPYKAQLAYQQRVAEKHAQCAARGETFKVCGVDSCYDTATERCDTERCFPPQPSASDDGEKKKKKKKQKKSAEKPKGECSAQLGFVKEVLGDNFQRARVCSNRQNEQTGGYEYTACGTKCEIASEGKCHWQSVPEAFAGERDTHVWCTNEEQHCAAAGCCIAADATCSAETTCPTAAERKAAAEKKKAAALAEDKAKQFFEQSSPVDTLDAEQLSLF